MKKVAVYIRVSSLEQANEGYSIPAQKERLSAFCKAHDWLIHNFYVDGGFTGANLERPGIQKLIAEISSFDLVLVYKLDRLSRSQKDTLFLIEEVFLPAGVDFVSVNESFDTSTPFGRAMIGILSVFAQLEREQIRERTMMGRLARAKEGLWLPTGNDPIGYVSKNGNLEILDYEAEQVRLIYELYASGETTSKIADRLYEKGFSYRYGKWSSPAAHTRVARILDNPLYKGTLVYAGIVVENTLPAIVENDLFEKVKVRRLAIRSTLKTAPTKTRYLLSGLVFCGHCGTRYFVRGGGGKYRYYTCYTRVNSVKHMKVGDRCENKTWPQKTLDTLVSDEISSLLFDPTYFEQLKKQKTATLTPPTSQVELSKKIANLDLQIGKFMDLYATSDIPVETLSAKIEQLHHEKTIFCEQLATYENPLPPPDFNFAVEELLSDLALVWELATGEERREVLLALVDRIVLDDENVNIEWSFLK